MVQNLTPVSSTLRYENKRDYRMTGEQLKKLREDAGITRTELGLALGFDEKQSRQRIYDYESERRGITKGIEVAIRMIIEKKISEKS